MNCTYTYKFPLDQWGRLGGMYSTADVPVARFLNQTRPGIILSYEDKEDAYEVEDDEEGFVRWIPAENVKITDPD